MSISYVTKRLRGRVTKTIPFGTRDPKNGYQNGKFYVLQTLAV